MKKKSPPDTLMLVHPTPWDDNFYARICATYLEIWNEELEGEEHGESGRFQKDMHQVYWRRDPAIEHLRESLSGSYPPFEEVEALLADQQNVSWRIFTEKPSLDSAKFLIRIAAAVNAVQSIATLVPSTSRAFPPSFTRQLCASDSIETIVSLFVHAWNNDAFMRTRGLTAFGFPEIEVPLVLGMNESYFDLLDLSASFILDGVPSFLRSLDLGRYQYSLSKMENPSEDPGSSIAGHFGVVRLARLD